MRLVSERRRVINLVSRLLLIAGHGFAQADSSTSITHDVVKPASSTASVEPTCESRTVNYITHTLPQQCLTSAPSPFSTPESVSAALTPSSAPVDATPAANDADGTAHHAELDADGNDLSTGAFMSFEEWKAMMLKKSGQEALEPRNRKTRDTNGDADPGENFDSLGDEGEVSFDFDAYSDRISEIASSTRPSQKEKDKERQVEKVTYDEGLTQGYRSKDAGKTCKERLSYASFDAGATVKKASPGAKNPKAILVENKDSYMLLECAMENKFVIIELSDDILVDTVVIANFEFFSSMIRHFRVSVSDRYPVKLEKWKVLGTFEARNSRDIQPFLVENPQIWAKYLRLEILSHYGNEYYCPVSLLRVHGTRMLDSWKEADPADLEVEEDKTVPESPEEAVEETQAQPEEAEVVEPPQPESQPVPLEQCEFAPYWDEYYFHYRFPFNLTCAAIDTEGFASQPNKEYGPNMGAAKPQAVWTVEQTAPMNMSASSSGTPTTEPAGRATVEPGRSGHPSNLSDVSANAAIRNSTESASISTSSQNAGSATVTPAASPTTPTTAGTAKTASVQSPAKSKTAASTYVKPPSSRSVAPKGQPSGSPTTPRNKTTSTTSSAASTPTIQDSFFKALNKRILALESNTTLSLQYIESQSRFLQEALARLERRQVAKVDHFLDTLNKTVLGELREVRTQYDQIWQSTVIALETQREQSEREIVALSSRLGVLADEVVFQKRMAIVQSVLLLGCLILVIFSRGGLAQAAAESSYYPAQFFAGATSSPSPVFPPSTPRPRQHLHRHATPPAHYRDSPGAAPLLSVDEASPVVPGTPHRNPNQTPDSALRHRARRSSSSRQIDASDSTSDSRARPSPSRSSTGPSAVSTGFYRAPTPPNVDAGYDSEPAMTPTRDRDRDRDEHEHVRNENGREDTDMDGEYYTTRSATNASARAEGMSMDVDMDISASTGKKGGVASYSETLARKAERQLTPSSEADGVGVGVGVDYVSLSSRPPLTHATSARKPLPALPEDPD